MLCWRLSLPFQFSSAFHWFTYYGISGEEDITRKVTFQLFLNSKSQACLSVHCFNITHIFCFQNTCLPLPIYWLAFLYWLNFTIPGKTGENLLNLNWDTSSQQNTDSNSITTSSLLGGEKKVPNLPQFSFSSISAATNNFSDLFIRLFLYFKKMRIYTKRSQ